MENERRWFLSSIVAVLAGVEPLFAALQQGNRLPRFPQIPDASQPYGSPNVPPALRPDPKALLKENQKKLRHDVEHLVELAGELKKEADETDQTDVLSLTFIRKAEEIEKLAKQIKSLARAD
jgi:hypothetical protein